MCGASKATAAKLPASGSKTLANKSLHGAELEVIVVTLISVCFRGHDVVVPSILATLHHRWGAAAITLQLPKSAPPQRDARPQ